MLPPEIIAEFQLLMQLQWQFLAFSWPMIAKNKYHRSELKEVNEISYLKSFVLDRLGYIPVFFFLVVLFGSEEYPRPYRNVEKGLLILYHLLSGCSVAEMGRFIPKSSFYALYRAFYIKNGRNLGEIIDRCLKEMFSNLKIRVLCALHFNPSEFKHITLLLDGHDTRASYLRAGDDTGSYYSYKLKKGGFRTQVCVDINGMVISVSDSSPCNINNDGSMLADIELKDIVTKWDCLDLDGGYTLFIPAIVSRNTHLTAKNFVHPIRKSRNTALGQDEERYNRAFGSFRSKIEAVFGEIGHLFSRFNGKSVIRVSDIESFTVQFKLACLLLNIKKFVALGGVTYSNHHTFWLQEGFDYGSDCSSPGTLHDEMSHTSVADKMEDAESMRELQRQFLSLSLSDQTRNLLQYEDGTEDTEMPPDHYEVSHIVSHRGPRESGQYRVRWVGYTAKEDEWVTADKFGQGTVVEEYEANLSRKRNR